MSPTPLELQPSLDLRCFSGLMIWATDAKPQTEQDKTPANRAQQLRAFDFPHATISCPEGPESALVCSGLGGWGQPPSRRPLPACCAVEVGRLNNRARPDMDMPGAVRRPGGHRSSDTSGQHPAVCKFGCFKTARHSRRCTACAWS